MHCEHARKLLDAHIDGELDGGTSAQLAQHLQSCPACARRLAERLALRDALRGLPVHRAPAGMREAILERLDTAVPKTAKKRRLILGWWQAAAMVAVPAAIAFGLGIWTASPPLEPDMRDAVAERHAAWLAEAGAEPRIASADRHAIKPWFAGRVDFAPPVRDLDAAGFRLVGGRLDRLGSTPAAVVAYRIRNHAIELFVWRGPGTRAVSPSALTRRGYAIITWAEDDLRFAAVSDVDPGDLQRFVAAIRAGPSQ